MVKDTGAAVGTDNIRALNRPLPLEAKNDEDGVPETLKLRGRWLQVESVVDRWRIEDEWWREEPVGRRYYQCLVDGGQRVTVFQDLGTGRWYHQRA
ncbi:MAG: hypothetical protein V3S82_08500 [Dehalococcoidia bacterium]